MSELFLSNVPWNCQESEVRQWVESKGFLVDSIRIVRDLVANASPAFAYVALCDKTEIIAAVNALNGQKLKDRILQVKEDWREYDPSREDIGPVQTHDLRRNRNYE